MVQRGDLWRLGNQYLLCADATEPETYRRIADLLPVEAVLTSPPYPHIRTYQEIGAVPFTVSEQALRRCAELPTVQNMFVNLGVVFRNGEVYRYWDRLIEVFPFPLFQILIWHKPNPRPQDTNGRFLPAFEFVFNFKRRGHKPPLRRSRPLKTAGATGKDMKFRNPDGTLRTYRTTVGYRTPKEGVEHNVIQLPSIPKRDLWLDHPAVFPVAFPQWFMKALGYASWLDPFAGSGSTLIAAEREGRQSIGVEIVPRYVEIALERARREGLKVEKVQ